MLPWIDISLEICASKDIKSLKLRRVAICNWNY